MTKKLPLLLTLMAGQAVAMELTIDDKRAIATDATEKMVVIPLQDQERKIPARLIHLIGALAGFYVEGAPLQMSPITKISLDTWQLIEAQLERAYVMTQGNQQVRDQIIADYGQLDTTSFIDLIRVIHYLTIPSLLEITLEIAQNKLTIDEILELADGLRIADYGQLDTTSFIDLIRVIHYLTIPSLLEITLEIAQNKLTIDEILELADGLRNEIIKGKALSIAKPIRGKELDVFDDDVWPHCVTSDGKIVYGRINGTLGVLDRYDKKQLEFVGCRTEDVDAFPFIHSVCVTQDNKIVSGSADETVRVWDMYGKELAVCRGHKDEVHSVCVTHDNKIVSGSADTTVRVWDMYGKELAVCRGHKDSVTSVCVTHNNKIVSGSWDKTVRVWDMYGKELAVCSGHEGWIRSVCVTHDNKIVSGSDDGTVRIWDMNGNQLAVCKGRP